MCTGNRLGAPAHPHRYSPSPPHVCVCVCMCAQGRYIQPSASLIVLLVGQVAVAAWAATITAKPATLQGASRLVVGGHHLQLQVRHTAMYSDKVTVTPMLVSARACKVARLVSPTRVVNGLPASMCVCVCTCSVGVPARAPFLLNEHHSVLGGDGRA